MLACLFDLDGTLLDTLHDLASSVNAMRAEFSLSPHSLEEVRKNIGNGVHVLVKKSLSVELLEKESVFDQALESMKGHYARLWDQETRPYPGIIALLDELKKRGIKLGVLSNKQHEATLKCVRRFFDPQYFSVVLGQRDGVPVKPDPAGAFDAMRELNVSAENCAYVGDSGVDYLTAKASGMLPISATWGFRTREELAQDGATLFVDEAEEILDLPFFN